MDTQQFEISINIQIKPVKQFTAQDMSRIARELMQQFLAAITQEPGQPNSDGTYNVQLTELWLESNIVTMLIETGFEIISMVVLGEPEETVTPVKDAPDVDDKSQCNQNSNLPHDTSSVDPPLPTNSSPQPSTSIAPPPQSTTSSKQPSTSNTPPPPLLGMLTRFLEEVNDLIYQLEHHSFTLQIDLLRSMAGLNKSYLKMQPLLDKSLSTGFRAQLDLATQQLHRYDNTMATETLKTLWSLINVAEKNLAAAHRKI